MGNTETFTTLRNCYPLNNVDRNKEYEGCIPVFADEDTVRNKTRYKSYCA